MGTHLIIYRSLLPSGRASAQQSDGRGFEPRSGQTKDFKIGTLEAASLDAQHYEVSARTGLPVSVYCDRVGCLRTVLYSYFPVWQHLKLSSKHRLKKDIYSVNGTLNTTEKKSL